MAPNTTSSVTIQRWVRLWNTTSVAMLVIASLIALLDTPRALPPKLLILAFGLLYLAWYRIFIVGLERWGSGSPVVAVSFALIMLVMAWMSSVHTVYLVLLFSMYGLLFNVLETRLAVPMTIFLSVLGAAIVISSNQMALPAAYGVLIGFAVATVFGIIMGRFISTIIRQNFERQHMIEELQAARAELAQAERQAGILEERQRLSREIHDTLAQGFTSIVMQLEAAEQALPPQGGPGLDAARRSLELARSTARENLAEARRFVWALRSEPLERETLAQAVRRVVEQWTAQSGGGTQSGGCAENSGSDESTGSAENRAAEESGAHACVEIAGDERPLPSAYEVTLLRAVQEGLANVRKHAAAHQVNLTLTYMDDQVILDVQDDGQGFDPAQPSPNGEGHGFGLIGMRERAEQLGGTLIIESTPGEGTTLVVTLPLAPDESEAQPGKE